MGRHSGTSVCGWDGDAGLRRPRGRRAQSRDRRCSRWKISRGNAFSASGSLGGRRRCSGVCCGPATGGGMGIAPSAGPIPTIHPRITQQDRRPEGGSSTRRKRAIHIQPGSGTRLRRSPRSARSGRERGSPDPDPPSGERDGVMRSDSAATRSAHHRRVPKGELRHETRTGMSQSPETVAPIQHIRRLRTTRRKRPFAGPAGEPGRIGSCCVPMVSSTMLSFHYFRKKSDDQTVVVHTGST